jgi:hypothetical protein
VHAEDDVQLNAEHLFGIPPETPKNSQYVPEKAFANVRKLPILGDDLDDFLEKTAKELDAKGHEALDVRLQTHVKADKSKRTGQDGDASEQMGNSKI